MFKPLLLALSILPAAIAAAQVPPAIPDDFPRFEVPGHEADMELLRDVFWLHYPGAGPKATLWDEWLTSPSLWPAVATGDQHGRFVREWSAALSGRILDTDGYVATHQHASIAHQLGWPFPFWKQGQGGWGWHFALPGMDPGWHATEPKTAGGWTMAGVEAGAIENDAWRIALTSPGAWVAPPQPIAIDTFQSPFIQLRWQATGLEGTSPYLEWTTAEAPEFSQTRRMRLEPAGPNGFTFTMVPVYKHPEWKGTVTGLRIQWNNAGSGAMIGIQGIFTQYDTRHTINNSNYVRGCAKYFNWTGDLGFLRAQLNRMRTAIRYMSTEFRLEETGIIVVDWVGHDGRSGIEIGPDGKKIIRSGRGIGNNYWDLLPMGNKDAYATIHAYDALRTMAEIERAVAAHPEWDLPGGALTLDPIELDRTVARAKETFNATFWIPATGRFACSVDIDGRAWDYGLTFLNLEAIHYGIASDEHASTAMDWIAGERLVDGDTAQGEDIYHWRFGPRATTRRNVDYYLWAWSNPESIPWGGQVQDGGGVFGFTYYDLMSRLRVRGPADASARMGDMLAWYKDVRGAGGYRKYYDGSREGTLQGGGTAGGLGCDSEFFESVLASQLVFDGFLGFEPTAEGFRLAPALPPDWPSLTVGPIAIKDCILKIAATHDGVTVEFISAGSASSSPIRIEHPDGWKVVDGDAATRLVSPSMIELQPAAGAVISFTQ